MITGRRNLGAFRWSLLLSIICLAPVERLDAALRNAPGDTIYTLPGQLVSVSPGRLNFYCMGSGSPTIVFDAGWEDWSPAWSVVQPRVASFTRACAYDRAGAGLSDPGPMPRTSARIADELHSALRAAGVKGPFILVGHAFGSYNTRAFADRYMPEVAGLVLIDPDVGDVETEHLRSRMHKTFIQQTVDLRACRDAVAKGTPLPPLPGMPDTTHGTCDQQFFRGLPENVFSPALNAALRELVRHKVPLYDTFISEIEEMPRDEVYLREHRKSFGARPVRIITAAHHFNDGPTTPVNRHLAHLRIEGDLAVSESRLLSLSTNSQQLIAYQSGYYSQLDQPDIVVGAIREVYDQSRQASTASSGAEIALPDTLGTQVRKYLKVNASRVVLEHVRVIDGTGAAAIADRNITIEGGKIAAISAGADVPPIDGTTILDLRGRAVMPGIVGMHDHLFYMARPNLDGDENADGPALFLEMPFSAPRLYLAAGVTTARTAGSANPNTDLRLKQAIEGGLLPGPHLDVTGPYLEGESSSNRNLQMQQLTSPADARRTVAYWADRGVTSFKAYQDITRDELRAAVDEAHKRGLKVTGHLCSVTYDEAIAAGIDNLEHGFQVNTAYDPDKKPDMCSASRGDYTLSHMDAGSAEAKRLIASLIEHKVAITSTLVLLASSVARQTSNDGGPPLRAEVRDAMSPAVRDAYDIWRKQPKSAQSTAPLRLKNEMELQRAFVAAGGLLLAGPDPVGYAGMLPGFGDQREVELLVEAGFSPIEAIKIATLNGARFLGRDRTIGSIARGKNADLVVVKGDPSSRIEDIENVELVFQDGRGYDPAMLLDSVKGHYGEY
jgi:imidazolonepropionase-like amidohydrolase/pimeloyl-ACP methyl ester carboxylesterase